MTGPSSHPLLNAVFSAFIAVMIIVIAAVAGVLAFGSVLADDVSQFTPLETVFKSAATLTGTTIGVYALMHIWQHRIEHQTLADIGLPGLSQVKEWGANFGVSFLLGLAILTLPAAICILLGAPWTFAMTNYPPAAWFGVILLLIPAFLIQSGSEELVFRGFLLTRLERSNSFPIAAILSSLLFAMMHGGNSVDATLTYFAALTCFGFFLAVLARYQGHIWGAIGFHFAWNITNLIGIGFRPSFEFESNPIQIMLFNVPHILEISPTIGQLHQLIFFLMLGMAITSVVFFGRAVIAEQKE